MKRTVLTPREFVFGFLMSTTLAIILMVALHYALSFCFDGDSIAAEQKQDVVWDAQKTSASEDVFPRDTKLIGRPNDLRLVTGFEEAVAEWRSDMKSYSSLPTSHFGEVLKQWDECARISEDGTIEISNIYAVRSLIERGDFETRNIAVLLNEIYNLRQQLKKEETP